MPGKLFIVTGPSGVGKTTVAEYLRRQRPDLKKLITCTTREPRQGEVDGVDYHFLSKAEFQDLINRGQMLEWAEVYDQLYGSRRADLDALLAEDGKILLVIDVQGAKTIKGLYPQAMVIFLTAEAEALQERIKTRGSLKAGELKRRLADLSEEMDFANQADAVVSNKEGKLEKTVAEVGRLID